MYVVLDSLVPVCMSKYIENDRIFLYDAEQIAKRKRWIGATKAIVEDHCTTLHGVHVIEASHEAGAQCVALAKQLEVVEQCHCSD